MFLHSLAQLPLMFASWSHGPFVGAERRRWCSTVNCRLYLRSPASRRLACVMFFQGDSALCSCVEIFPSAECMKQGMQNSHITASTPGDHRGVTKEALSCASPAFYRASPRRESWRWVLSSFLLPRVSFLGRGSYHQGAELGRLSQVSCHL